MSRTVLVFNGGRCIKEIENVSHVDNYCNGQHLIVHTKDGDFELYNATVVLTPNKGEE